MAFPLPSFGGVLRCGKLDAQGRSEFEARIEQAYAASAHGEHEVIYSVHGYRVSGDDFRTLLSLNHERALEVEDVERDNRHAESMSQLQAFMEATMQGTTKPG